MHRLAEPDQAVAWVGLANAAPEEIEQVAQIFHLHPLAVEDAIVAHQRPKIERYDDTLFVVLRPATYDDDTETVHLGELHLFIGPDFVVTVRHSDEPRLAPVRKRMDNDPHLMALGPEAVLYAVLDFVVDGYAPVIAGLENDIDEIEEQVFESDPAVSRRIYELSREVLALQRATKPLLDILEALKRGHEKYGVDEELRRNMRDVADHATGVVERVDGFRQTLMSILSLNSTLVAQTQNEKMTRLAETANQQSDRVKSASSWAAILFAPTVIAGIYGMNFDKMPELPLVLGIPHGHRVDGAHLHHDVHRLPPPRLDLTDLFPRPKKSDFVDSTVHCVGFVETPRGKATQVTERVTGVTSEPSSPVGRPARGRVTFDSTASARRTTPRSPTARSTRHGPRAMRCTNRDEHLRRTVT